MKCQCNCLCISFFLLALYSIILFCVFLWIPFVYFYYEEKEEDDGNTCSVSLLYEMHQAMKRQMNVAKTWKQQWFFNLQMVLTLWYLSLLL